MIVVCAASKPVQLSTPACARVAFFALLLCETLGCSRPQEPARAATPHVASNVAPTSRRDPAPTSHAADGAATARAEPAESGERADALTRELPTECAPGASSCTPPPGFAEGVCRSKYPELALVLFSKGTPWQRAYVKAETVEPVNVYGGERGDRWLYFGEEVLVLRERGGATGSIKVSGPTDVDILRWDGTCATIRKEMLVPYVTAPMTSVRILWKYLDEGFQQALARDELVARAEEAQRRDCRSSSVKNPTEACDKVMRKLTDRIVLAVKNGAELPAPATVPAWKR